MFNFNLPTLLPNLIYQLAQFILQSQTASSPSQFEPHQPLKQTSQYRNQEYCETSCLAPIIRLQSLQLQFLPASHPILEWPDVKCLGNTLLKRLIIEQLDGFNKIIDESLCDPIDDKQILKVLEFTLKLIKHIITVDKNKGTEKSYTHLHTFEDVPTTNPNRNDPP
ncbi:24886_t:CDS:2 [Gigaspora margarita]|uniref:24886_t:CDS:1 n=1 Tax=Gigaspora margarita TaxID=4874 RepID=A0ABN7W791_GIGMA|nr:24886_t:CDS:2 [Gigaspora margarita]